MLNDIIIMWILVQLHASKLLWFLMSIVLVCDILKFIIDWKCSDD